MDVEAQVGHCEPYGVGLRRRIRTALLVIGFFLLASAACYAAFVATKSVTVVLVVGVIGGIWGAMADIKSDPLPATGRTSRSDTVIWLVLFGPVLVVLTMLLVYSAQKPSSGVELVGATVVSILLGSIIASTRIMLRKKTTP